jgi:glutamyl-tRNA synthetase
MINKEIIKAYALKNAVEHGGRAIIGSVVNSLFNEGLEKNKIKEIIPKVNSVLKEVNSISLEEQKKHLSERENLIGHRPERDGLPELVDAKKGKVITRFSPSPSGPLTLGHILTIGPNYLYVKKYGGKFYIRIEDTNPENIYKPSYKMIEKEAKWLCNNNVKIVIQSERMKKYYDYAEKLIKKNKAYVCECDADEFKKLILAKEPCSCRNLSVNEQLRRWKKMFDKKGYKEGEVVLRFKSNLKDPNPAMRDFSLARINETPHPKQGKKYRVWPLMNLAVSVDDMEMKITHVIRGKDHKDNAKKQEMIFSVFNKKYPWNEYLGRLHFKDLVLSTSQFRKDIKAGKYKGWDDKRLPTAISLKKQGFDPEVFWKFVEQRGISEADKVISKKDFFCILNSFNKNFK